MRLFRVRMVLVRRLRGWVVVVVVIWIDVVWMLVMLGRLRRAGDGIRWVWNAMALWTGDVIGMEFAGLAGLESERPWFSL